MTQQPLNEIIIQSSAPWPRTLLIGGAGIVALLSFINPSATAGQSGLERLIFWSVHVSVALALLTIAQIVLSRWSLFKRAAGWLQIFVSGVVGALLFTPIAMGLDLVFVAGDGEGEAASSFVLSFFEEFAQLGVPVLIFWMLLNSFRLMEDYQASASSGGSVDDQRASNFWKRIPMRIGRDIVSLSAELHYLRVHTVQGDSLILHSFTDAMEVIGDVPGMQIHRSHWVSFAHIDDVAMQGGRLLCATKKGVSLPVSRPYRATLKEKLAQFRATDDVGKLENA